MVGIVHIVLARKPLEGTVAENCLQWGCGALWIDGCRVGISTNDCGGFRTGAYTKKNDKRTSWEILENGETYRKEQHLLGRFPANLILGGKEVVMWFPITKSNDPGTTHVKAIGWGHCAERRNTGYKGDSGSASRFFFNFLEQESDE